MDNIGLPVDSSLIAFRSPVVSALALTTVIESALVLFATGSPAQFFQLHLIRPAWFTAWCGGLPLRLCGVPLTCRTPDSAAFQTPSVCCLVFPKIKWRLVP